MQPSDALDVHHAYAAARDRALRTTDALMVAEGQIRDLSGQLEAVTGERDKLLREREESRARRRERDAARRARGEGRGDAAEDADPVGYTGAVGQAD